VTGTVGRTSMSGGVAGLGQRVGIAPELPFVFERFRQADASSTRRQDGLGLGLAIVRHLAEVHGGSVIAESAGPGLGATSTLRLPLLDLTEPVPGLRRVPVAVPAAAALAGPTLEGVSVLSLLHPRLRHRLNSALSATVGD
jgi:hypothetical protein